MSGCRDEEGGHDEARLTASSSALHRWPPCAPLPPRALLVAVVMRSLHGRGRRRWLRDDFKSTSRRNLPSHYVPLPPSEGHRGCRGYRWTRVDRKALIELQHRLPGRPFFYSQLDRWCLDLSLLAHFPHLPHRLDQIVAERHSRRLGARPLRLESKLDNLVSSEICSLPRQSHVQRLWGEKVDSQLTP